MQSDEHKKNLKEYETHIANQLKVLMLMDPEIRRKPGGDYAPWGIFVLGEHWRFPCQVLYYRCLMCNPDGNNDIEIGGSDYPFTCEMVTKKFGNTPYTYWKPLETMDHGIYSCDPKNHRKKCQSWDP